MKQLALGIGLDAELGPLTLANVSVAADAREVAKAESDGTTLVIGTNQTHATNAFLLKEPGYDPVASFAPVAGLAVGAGLTAAAALAGTFMAYDLQRTGALLSVLAIAMLVCAGRLALVVAGPMVSRTSGTMISMQSSGVVKLRIAPGRVRSRKRSR